MNSVVVGIGSNINPQEHVEEALSLLAYEHSLVQVSSLIYTKPIGRADQPNYLNGSALIRTPLTQDAFNQYLKDLERRLGRVHTADKYGPRTIDLDIVIWNGMIVNDDFLNRDFVRKSVLELLPELEGYNR